MTAPHIIAAVIFGLMSAGAALTVGIGAPSAVFAPLMALIALGAAAWACLKAPSGKQAMGRGLLVFGGTAIVMPILLAGALGQKFEDQTVQTMLTDERVMTEAMVSTMLIGASTLLGFLVGGIAVIVGLILNRAPRARDMAPTV